MSATPPRDPALSIVESRTEAEPSQTAEPAKNISAILAGLPAMVSYWDSRMRNRAATRAFVEFFGLTPEDIRGRYVGEVLGPELYALSREHIERVLAGEPELFDRTVIDARGCPRHTQTSYIPDVVDGTVRGFFVLVTDITEQRVAEQARVAAETQFRGLLESAPDAMVIINAKGEIVIVNAQAEKLFCYPRDEMLGQGVEMLVPKRWSAPRGC